MGGEGWTYGFAGDVGDVWALRLVEVGEIVLVADGELGGERREREVVEVRGGAARVAVVGDLEVE